MTVKLMVFSLVPSFLRKYTDRIEASPLGYRLAKGAFWSLLGAVLSRSLTLVASIIVARIIGKEGFGVLGIIQNTVGMFGIFAGFGMGMTATKHIAEFRETDPQRAGHIVALSSLVSIATGGAMAIALFVFSPWLAANTLAAPQLSELLRISALLLFLSAINGTQTGVLAGFESFKTIAGINITVGLLSFPVMVGCVLVWQVTGAVWGLTITMGLNCVFNYIGVRSLVRERNILIGCKGCFTAWPILWKFSVPAILAGAMVAPVSWGCNAMLVNQTNGYAEMGILNAVNQWFNALMFLPGILGQVLLPILSERMGVNETAHSGRAMVLSMKLNALVTGSLAVVLAGLSPFLMGLYGPSFRQAWPVFIVALLTAVLLSVQTPVEHVIVAAGRMWVVFWMNMGWGLAFIGLTYGLLTWGALGVSSARGFSYVVTASWTFAFAFHYLKVNKARKS